jgi:hypothetical protein
VTAQNIIARERLYRLLVFGQLAGLFLRADKTVLQVT